MRVDAGGSIICSIFIRALRKGAIVSCAWVGMSV